uniref:CSON011061 protein n=1 Tax=Culicoides sonorensis TaxID=179676 RepID=A0A336M5I9_CULSO
MYLKFNIMWFLLLHLRQVTNSTQLDGSGLPGEYKDPCRNSNDCRIYAYFCGRSFHCECNYGFKVDGKNETCIGAVGTQCTYDSHCISKAFCKDHKICTCKYEFPYVSDDSWECYGEWESSAMQQQQQLDKRLFMFFTIVG